MIAPVKDEPVVRMQLEIRRDIVFDSALNSVHGFTGGDASAIADAKDMGVYCLRGLMPPHVQHDVGGLAPNAGQ